LRDTFEQSLWAASAPPAPEAPALEGEARADVAIVGAGFLGLSLALHLAERGIAVRVLEAKAIGWGASGRNTGFVVPSLKLDMSLARLRARLGSEHGERLARLVGESGALVFDLIRRHDISCEAEQRGWLQPAHRAELLPLLEAQQRERSMLGVKSELLDRAATERVTGSPRFHGALLIPSGGQINPLGYVRGLARASIAAGARIHADTPVASLARDAAGWRLTTPRGAILADKIVLATNALIGTLVPEVARSLIPVNAYQVASEPLDAETLRWLLPARHCVADLERVTFAVRLSADNRLVTGGGAALNADGSVARLAAYYLRRLARFFPRLAPQRAAFAWHGVVAGTGDFLPRLWDLGGGAYAPIGCNGRGVALTTALGARLAEFVASGDARALPIGLAPPKPFPQHWLSRHAASVWLPWNRLRDRLDTR
jgi:glycine/D-amino acid oxidase-like deaminating enzyme